MVDHQKNLRRNPVSPIVSLVEMDFEKSNSCTGLIFHCGIIVRRRSKIFSGITVWNISTLVAVVRMVEKLDFTLAAYTAYSIQYIFKISFTWLQWPNALV